MPILTLFLFASTGYITILVVVTVVVKATALDDATCAATKDAENASEE